MIFPSLCMSMEVPYGFIQFKTKSRGNRIAYRTNNDDHDRDDHDYRDRLYPDGGLQYSLEFSFGELEFDFDLRHATLHSIG